LPSGICFSQFLTFSYSLSRVEGHALLLIQIEGRAILCRDRSGQMLKASERVIWFFPKYAPGLEISKNIFHGLGNGPRTETIDILDDHQIYPLIDHYVKIQTEVIADYAENTPSAAVIVRLFNCLQLVAW